MNAKREPHTTVTNPPHDCEPAGTISASLEANGLDVTIMAFAITPENREKLERLVHGLDSLFKLMDETAE